MTQLRTSFSQNMLFWNCPRSWYMSKILKIPGISDMCYADRGNAVHHCLEKFYPDKTMTIEEVNAKFEQEWKQYKLDNTKLKTKKDESWLMVINGMNLDLDFTSTELKIFYPDVVAYIDALNSHKHKITDWKSSTRAGYNEIEYTMQLKYYSWLYERKFGVLPEYCDVRYLKYTGTKSVLGFKPTKEDAQNAEKWHIETQRRMAFYIKHPEKLPPFNKGYFFSPYKHLWDLEEKPTSDLKTFIIEVVGGFFYIKGDVDKFLSTHFKKKYSYELKNAFYIKKAKKDANTTITFWHEKQRRLPIGFLKETLISLHDYAIFKKKTPVINVVDKRIFDETIVQMPEKLLSGKELRPYQLKAVNTYLDRHKICMLELSTGSGKTLMTAEIVRRLGCISLFVVDKKELLYQTKEVFEENLGIEIGVLGDGKKDIKDISIATIQTIMKMLDYTTAVNVFKKSIKNKRWKEYVIQNNIVIEFDDMDGSDMTMEQHEIHDKSYETFEKKKKLFFKNYKFNDEETKEIGIKINEEIKKVEEFKKYLASIRLCIMDECHKAASNSYYKLGLNIVNAEYRLGVSATARRDDGNDMMLHATCGRVVFSLTGQELIETGYLMKPDIVFLNQNIPADALKLMEDDSLKGYINEIPKYDLFYPNFIVKNKYRNNAIKQLVTNHTGKSILILVKHIEHGKLLEELIPGSQYIYGETAGGIRTQTLEDFKNGKLNILVSMISIFAEGVDIPSLDIVINASANKGDIKSIQVLGRVLRKNKGKEKARYYDFADNGMFFRTASEARVKAFRAEGHYVSFDNVEVD